MKRQSLREYIRAQGVSQCAKEWGFSERAVESWLYGARIPKREAAQKIIRKSGLSWEAIYGHAA